MKLSLDWDNFSPSSFYKRMSKRKREREKSVFFVFVDLVSELPVSEKTLKNKKIMFKIKNRKKKTKNKKTNNYTIPVQPPDTSKHPL